jgi:hypothetical protein
MSGSDDINPKVWGRRPYAGKQARELMNDVSAWIARTRPQGVDDPENPSLSDVLAYAGPALRQPDTPDDDVDAKDATLTRLMADGLDYQEAVVWYWFRYCQFDITEIHYAMTGSNQGGDPSQRRNSTRNIIRVLQSAASKVQDADPDDVPSMVDDRSRHDRTDGIPTTPNDDT